MQRKVNWIPLYVGIALDLALLLGVKFLAVADWLETLLEVVVVLAGGIACLLWLSNNRAGLWRESRADPLLWGDEAGSSSRSDGELECDIDAPTLVLVIHACDISDEAASPTYACSDVGPTARPTR